LKPKTIVFSVFWRSSPRPHRRGRIETLILENWPKTLGVPPGLTAGGGLKRDNLDQEIDCNAFPPASPPGAD